MPLGQGFCGGNLDLLRISGLKLSAPVSPCVKKRSNRKRGTCGGFSPTVSSHRGRKGCEMKLKKRVGTAMSLSGVVTLMGV